MGNSSKVVANSSPKIGAILYRAKKLHGWLRNRARVLSFCRRTRSFSQTDATAGHSIAISGWWAAGRGLQLYSSLGQRSRESSEPQHSPLYIGQGLSVRRIILAQQAPNPSQNDADENLLPHCGSWTAIQKELLIR